MKNALFAFVAALGLCVQFAWAGEQTVTLDVQNMTCALCPITVSTAIKAIPGVRSVDVSVEHRSAVVVFDDELSSVDNIAQASTDAGYPTRKHP